MSRTLRILFRRDPLSDRNAGNVNFEGYRILWPDGKPVATAMDAFCNQGQRLLGLGKHLAGCQEKIVNLVFLPLSGRDDGLNRIPGYRVPVSTLNGRPDRAHSFSGWHPHRYHLRHSQRRSAPAQLGGNV